MLTERAQNHIHKKIQASTPHKEPKQGKMKLLEYL